MAQENSKKTSIKEDINLRDIIDIYLNHWVWFLITTTICLIIAFIHLKLTKPVYKAVSSVIIKNEESSASSNASVFNDLGLMSGFTTNEITNELGLLKSKRLMNSTIDALDFNIKYYESDQISSNEIYNTSPFIINVISINNKSLKKTIDQDQNTLMIKSMGENDVEIVNVVRNKSLVYKIGEVVDLNFVKFIVEKNVNYDDISSKEVLIRIDFVESVVNDYRSRLKVDLVEENSTLIELSIEDHVKEKAETVLNQLIYQYNLEAIEDKNLMASNTAKFIDERLKIINKELDSVEVGKEEFKEINKLTDIEVESALYVENASDYQIKNQEVTTQLGLVNAMLSYLKKEGADLLPTNLGIQEGNINGLISEYNSLVLERNRILAGATETNPIVVKLNYQLNQLKANVNSSLLRKRANLRISLRDLERQSGRIDSQISRVPEKERLFRNIERQQNVKETLYLFLLQKREENSLSLAATAPKAKIVDRAYAIPSPISPNSKLVIFTAFIIGLVLPFLVINAFLLLDNKINDKEYILKNADSLPVIGQLPRIEDSNQVLVEENDRSVLSETLRILISNFHYLIDNSEGGKPKVIFVTSSVKGEGKTLTSVNLAKMLAISDKKTVLVGADLRNPQLGNYESKLRQYSGLSNFLSDENSNIDELLVDSSLHENLSILSSGPIPPNPAELLGKEKTQILFNKLKERFEYIIVDTPPAMILVDTFSISKYADLVLYIIRAGVTDKKLLSVPVEAKQDGKFKNLGIVLNDVNYKKFGYGKNYGYYYGSEDELGKNVKTQKIKKALYNLIKKIRK